MPGRLTWQVDYVLLKEACSANQRRRRGSNRERMSAQRDRPVDFSIDLQIFCAGDMTLDLQAGTEARGAASGTTAERRATAERWSRRIVEGDDRGFCCLGRC